MDSGNYQYLEILERGTDKIVKRFNSLGRTLRQLEKAQIGCNINLNHEKFYTRIETYDKPQEIIDGEY